MLNLIVNGTKIAVLAFWAAFVLSLLSVVPDPYSLFIFWLGGLVLLIHLAEYLFVKYRFAGTEAGEINFVKTMLFGFTHWLPLIIDERENKS